MRKRQLGVTFIGWVILLTPFVIVGYAGMRLTPVYLNYMKVAKALDQAVTELKSGGASNPQAIRNTIDKHFMVDVVDYPTSKDFKITREDGAWVVEAQYDDEAPLFSNVTLHVAFDKTVRIGGTTE